LRGDALRVRAVERVYERALGRRAYWPFTQPARIDRKSGGDGLIDDAPHNVKERSWRGFAADMLKTSMLYR
jgi:hypothetical protein